MNASEDGIIIKGSREGLLITLGPGAWHIALGALEARLTATPEFFKGARVALLVGSRKLVEADVRAARDLLAQHDVLLWGIIGDDEETQHVAAVMGLDAELPQRDRVKPRPQPVEPAEPIEPPIPIGTGNAATPLESAPADDPEAGLIARRTLRSGQQTAPSGQHHRHRRCESRRRGRGRRRCGRVGQAARHGTCRGDGQRNRRGVRAGSGSHAVCGSRSTLRARRKVVGVNRRRKWPGCATAKLWPSRGR